MVLSRAVPVRDEDGHIQRWYGSTEDIEEEWQAQCARREALQRLRESEELYRFTVELTQQIVWSVEPDGTGLTLSRRFYELTGTDPGDDAALSLHPDERERVVSTWRACLESGHAYADECHLRMKDGSYRSFRLRAAPLRDAEGHIVRWYGMTEDIHEERTAERRAEDEIRRMQSELIHVSRLSAMGAMASALAHELNQPLAAISNYLSGARRLASKPDAPDRPDALIEALSQAASGAQRAGEIVRRLRELVARGAVAVVDEHLPRLIEEAGVLGFVDAKLLGVRHRLALDRTAQWVRADRVQIQQVLINLIRNAVEAMQHSRTREIVISTRLLEDEMVEVAVADSGPGIAAEHMESLFSQFMTTKSGGMGIGLPICRTIVEGHGGKIWAENRPEGGALFRFTLPAAEPPESA